MERCSGCYTVPPVGATVAVYYICEKPESAAAPRDRKPKSVQRKPRTPRHKFKSPPEPGVHPMKKRSRSGSDSTETSPHVMMPVRTGRPAKSKKQKQPPPQQQEKPTEAVSDDVAPPKPKQLRREQVDVDAILCTPKKGAAADTSSSNRSAPNKQTEGIDSTRLSQQDMIMERDIMSWTAEMVHNYLCLKDLETRDKPYIHTVTYLHRVGPVLQFEFLCLLGKSKTARDRREFWIPYGILNRTSQFGQALTTSGFVASEDMFLHFELVPHQEQFRGPRTRDIEQYRKSLGICTSGFMPSEYTVKSMEDVRKMHGHHLRHKSATMHADGTYSSNFSPALFEQAQIEQLGSTDQLAKFLQVRIRSLKQPQSRYNIIVVSDESALLRDSTSLRSCVTPTMACELPLMRLLRLLFHAGIGVTHFTQCALRVDHHAAIGNAMREQYGCWAFYCVGRLVCRVCGREQQTYECRDCATRGCMATSELQPEASMPAAIMEAITKAIRSAEFVLVVGGSQLVTNVWYSKQLQTSGTSSLWITSADAKAHAATIVPQNITSICTDGHIDDLLADLLDKMATN